MNGRNEHGSEDHQGGRATNQADDTGSRCDRHQPIALPDWHQRAGPGSDGDERNASVG